MSRPDGGPAFPGAHSLIQSETSKTGWELTTSHGMSLRDYFAAAALQGTLATVRQWHQDNIQQEAENVTRNAYAIADYMLAERAR